MPARKKIKEAALPQFHEPSPVYGSGQEALTFEKVWLMFQETRQRQEETDRQMKETDKKIKQLSNLFTTQWGKLMEALITPSCLKLFKERGLDIMRTYTNVKVETNELEGEFDIVLADGNEVVIVEVKTTMTSGYVNDFLEKMARIREYLPEHKEKTIFGAVAAIKYENASDKYAYKNGLFVLINKGEDIIKIANKQGFVPKAF